MKYKCEDCGEIFEEDKLVHKVVYDTVEYWGANVKMPFDEYFCPYCNSEEVDEYMEYEGEINENDNK